MAHERTARLSASPPLFESRFLDFFSRIHPVGAGADLRAGDRRADRRSAPATARARSRSSLLVARPGCCIWTLSEYWLHRKIFHWEPDHPIGQRLHFIIHGVHHDHPNDRMRLVMPPGASIPLAALFFGALLADLRAADRATRCSPAF